MNVTRLEAETWATWFRALGDPTRLLILNLMATEGRSMTVGEITERLDVGQSTVSHHLSTLAEVRFVLVERVGTASFWQVNERCLECFPDAAGLVLGKVPDDFLTALECR
ncbi:MAG: metalloregulator ArsR/SmtB family transcription factor [Acidimicrobiia bacterium]